MRNWLTVLGVALVVCSLAAEEPLLDRLTVHATGPVTVTVPCEPAPSDSIFRMQDGSWAALEVAYEEGRATFSLPVEAGGRTTVLLTVPEWLELEDETPPAVQDLTVDGRELEVAPEVDLGHTPGAPKSIRFIVKDDMNPIDAGAASLTLDGMPLPDDAATFSPVRNGPETRIVDIALPDVQPAVHALKLRIPDAAAVAHFAELTVRFNTAPLVRDGGFEEIKADGTSVRWGASMWSTDAETKAELKIVEGGHSGEYCAEITGIAGGLNLLFGQQVSLTGGRSYLLKGFYKATGTGGFISLIADGDKSKEQYLNAPHFKPAEDWTPFEWTFSVKPAKRFSLYLRNAGKGSIWYDDVALEEVAQTE